MEKISEEQLNNLIAAMPGEKVTEEYIKSRLIGEGTFFTASGGTLTLCVLQVDNGFRVVGESACANPANFNEEIGRQLAYRSAFNKLWPLFGFLLCEKLFRFNNR